MTFDASSFMEQTIDAPMSTEVEQVPEGEYRAMIDDFDASAFRTFTSQKNGKDFTIFSPPFILQDDALAAKLGRERLVVYHKGMFLDFDDKGGLDTSKGKNVQLGQLRDATGQNAGGPWGFGQLKGAGPVMVKVSHDVGNDGVARARVTRVVKIG